LRHLLRSRGAFRSRVLFKGKNQSGADGDHAECERRQGHEFDTHGKPSKCLWILKTRKRAKLQDLAA
jgi:hypothetical protein